MTEAADETGYVYYARIGRNIKIGYAKNVRSRLSSYPPETELLAVEPGGYALELERLGQFSEDLVWGNEWFHPSRELKDHVAMIRRVRGLPSEEDAYQYTARKARSTPQRAALVAAESAQWLTIQEAAEEIAVSVKTMRRYITRGIVEAKRIDRRLIRVSAKSLRTMGSNLQYIPN